MMNFRKGTIAAVVMACSAVAVAQQGNERIGRTAESNDRGDAKQQLDRTEQRSRDEAQAQGSRMVQVQEKALWGLGDLAPVLMHKSMEKLATEPDEAYKCVMQAGNILQLQAALGEGSRESQELKRHGEDLLQLARDIQFKKVLTKDELKRPFSRAAMAGAAFYQKAAQNGLQRQDEEQTGYTMKAASEYLTLAHVYGERQPTAEVSRAMFDAERLAKQVIKTSKPTTFQDQQKGQEREGDLNNPVRLSDRRQDLPPEARQVLDNLARAIEQSQGDGAARQRDIQ